MQKHPRKLLVVITEAAIERALIADLRRLGAMGYTVNEVRGGGSTGERSGEWEAERSVTFPFNVTVGIPLYLELARRLAG